LAVLSIITLSSNAFAGWECLLSKVKDVRTMKLVFTQEMRLPMAGDSVPTFSGVVYYKRPLKFRWEYTRGSDAILVSDGNLLEMKVPSAGQCQVNRLSGYQEVFPLFQMAEDSQAFSRLFRTVSEGPNTVKLVPAFKNSAFEEITIYLEGNCNIRAMKIRDQFGAELIYNFDSFTVNEDLPDSLFEIEPCK